VDSKRIRKDRWERDLRYRLKLKLPDILHDEVG